MYIAYIGLGSNLQQPQQQLKTALGLLDEIEGVSLLQASSFYGSKPQGPQDQPDFINAVAKLSTQHSPEALLTQLQAVEQQLGKVKVRHWGERCIDLDLLLYGQEEVTAQGVVFNSVERQTVDLTLPHPMMWQRDFVLLPLYELQPDLILTDAKGQTAPIEQWIQQLPEQFVVKEISA